MTNKLMDCCRVCRYWSEIGKGRGFCLSAPPVPLAILRPDGVTYVETHFPQTKETMSCGVFNHAYSSTR